jgi:hypothetical protein
MACNSTSRADVPSGPARIPATAGAITAGSGRCGGYPAGVSSIAPLSLDTAPLLDWAGRHGDPLDPRAAEAVVGLLALSEARRRTGLPEPAPELVKELMLVLLPLYVSAIPAELAGFPAALVALIGYTHEAGKLNAKRRDRLIAEVERLGPQFEAAMTSPRRITWAQLTGIPGFTEEDREELEPAAARLVAVLDRLAGLGITTRTGDAITLTPLGSALVRDALVLGTKELDEKAAASFPTQDEVLSWDARQLVGAVGN